MDWINELNVLEESLRDLLGRVDGANRDAVLTMLAEIEAVRLDLLAEALPPMEAARARAQARIQHVKFEALAKAVVK